ncbi:hypothetical protein ACFGVR_11770 [Mucilaginibacter sp. AW1-3]
MKLNEEQLADLQRELNYAVKYRETYDELYDHVLTGIEAYDGQPADPTLMAKQIIKNEFGGYEALKRMEEDRVKLVNRAMRKKHGQNMREFFNFPMAVLTIAVTVAAYFIARTPHGREALLIFTMFSAITPIMFLFYKKAAKRYREWHTDNYQKQSLKDNYIFIAAILANSMFNVLNMSLKHLPINAPLAMCIFVLYMVYVLSFFKLYRQEFRMQLT